ncbi:MAG: ATP-binding cassette domain-containing protein, partial [Hyphomicrobiales bacterium]
MTLDVRLTHKLGDFALDIAFNIAAPGVTALFGPSGSGKTATVNAIAGILKPDAGRIRLNGATLLDTADGTWVATHKRRLGYVFQDARLFPHLKVLANVMFGARRAREKPSQAMV